MLNESEIKALVALLDDEDDEVISHVEDKIMSVGTGIIPHLEQEWKNTSNPIIQRILHKVQFTLFQERFLNWKTHGGEDLLEGLWIIATYEYPDLKMDELLQEVEQFYQELRQHITGVVTPYDQIKFFNQGFFNQLNFRPNTKNFHSPANSMINTVLKTRKGNPISLCVVYMILARKMGLPIYGVNLPNLFILTYKANKGFFYINVFNRGLIFTKEDIDNYLENLQLEKLDIFYEPCSYLDVILRVLRNLIISFEKLGDYRKADEITLVLQKMDDQYFSL